MNSPGCGGLCIDISDSPRNPGCRRLRIRTQTLSASFRLPIQTRGHDRPLSDGEDETLECSCLLWSARYQELPTSCVVALLVAVECLPRYPTQRTSAVPCVGMIESRVHHSPLRSAQQANLLA